MNELRHRESLKILLVLPAGENVRVTPQRPAVPRRAMLRFSVLPLTVVAALTPSEHEVRVIDENVEALDFEAECDVVGITFMTALAPRAFEIADRFRQRGKIGALWRVGWRPAWLGLKLGLTYRYDNRMEGIRGRNPAAPRKTNESTIQCYSVDPCPGG